MNGYYGDYGDYGCCIRCGVSWVSCGCNGDPKPIITCVRMDIQYDRLPVPFSSELHHKHKLTVRE